MRLFFPEVQELAREHGLSMSEDGGLAFQTLETLVAEVAVETAAFAELPLSAFTTAARPVYVCIQLDAVRHRTRQFMAVVVKNSQSNSQSCFASRLLAFGTRMKDDRSGVEQLLAANLDFIGHLLSKHTFCVDGVPAVPFELFFTGDFAGVRAIENAICGCSAEAMHCVPTARDVATLAAVKATCRECDCRATVEQRTARAHQPVAEGEPVSPCDCCIFGHDRSSTAQAELEALEGKLTSLKAGYETESDKRDLSLFLSAHKKKHSGTNPGPHIVPLTSAGLGRWIVNLLRVDLNLGKLPCVEVGARSPPARCAQGIAPAVRRRISDFLVSVGLPLDMRTKEEGRVAPEKFLE
eukprot:813929-Pleurochrysis_carterae.AAC.2